jgi:hypothetical protein
MMLASCHFMLCTVALKFGAQQGTSEGIQDTMQSKGSERKTVVAGLAYGSE